MTLPPTSYAPRAGDALAGRYLLVRKLGEGSGGVVWEARQRTTDRAVAVKLLKGDDAPDVARFFREAKIVAGLSHPNIVQVFDFWEGDGTMPAFLVMELLSGESLAAYLERSGPLGVEEARRLMAPVASALAAAHAQGVVHRDLKPDNIFLVRPPDRRTVDVKVVDFGLAKPATADRDAPKVSQTGSVLGTPIYMSPEQVYCERDIDTRSDVWSFGVVLYECLSGRPPFDGESFGQIFRQITRVEFRPLREVAPHVPAWLEDVVGEMLVEDRARRLDIGAVSAALRSGSHRRELAPAAGNGRGLRPTILAGALLLAASGAVGLSHFTRTRRAERSAPAPTEVLAAPSLAPYAPPSGERVVDVATLPSASAARPLTPRRPRRAPSSPSAAPEGTPSAAEPSDPMGGGRF